MKRFFTIVLLMTIIFGIFAVCTVSNADDETTTDTITWTDFSNAKYEIKYSSAGHSFIDISEIEVSQALPTYYWFITPNNTKPEFDESNINNYKNNKVIGSKTSKSISINAAEYLELNQDVYLWIVEEQYNNSKTNYNFVLEGKKIERTGYAKDNNLFFASYISYNANQIIFNNIAWGEHTRNIKLKIGKITDATILNKIKNNANDGFTDLLQYSKTAQTVYDNQLVSSKYKTGSFYMGYNTTANFDGTPINIPITSLEDKAYYFVYATLDDENGKYYPVEGVTITQASVFKTLEDQPWFLFLYGTNNFNWSEFESGSSSSTTPKVDPDGDPTVAPTILPKTGVNLTIILAIVGLATAGVVSYQKYKMWKEIK
ncbi:MAG: hypothetical protein IKF83_03435 [Clostridia bacterium]|nr:hypothetical protein [Clostridia bacterium]